MIGPNELTGAFERNLNILKAQAEGLTQADSLLQLPFQGNCLNWVLGHIAVNRDEVLAVLGEPAVIAAERSIYKRESEKMSGDEEGILSLEELFARLDRSQARIAEGLGKQDEKSMAEEITYGGRTMALERRVFFLYFHETYHVGQTELLRQLAGKNDKII